jgi:hypothetical protein
MATTMLTVSIDTSAVMTAIREIVDLYGTGNDLPDDLLQRVRALSGCDLRRPEIVDFQWTGGTCICRPGKEIDALLHDLRAARGCGVSV